MNGQNVCDGQNREILKEKPLAWRDRLEKMLDEAVERGNKKSVGRALKDFSSFAMTMREDCF